MVPPETADISEKDHTFQDRFVEKKLRYSFQIFEYQASQDTNNSKAKIDALVISRNETSRVSETEELLPKRILVMIPGVSFPKEDGVNVGVELLEQNSEFDEFVFFDSFVSENVSPSVYPSNYAESSRRYALAIEQYIKASGADETVLVGYSLGGKLMPEVFSFLQKRAPSIAHQVKGIILLNSGGIFNQSRVDFIRRNLGKNRETFPNETETLFPNPILIFHLRVASREAHRNHKVDEALHLEHLADYYTQLMGRNMSDGNDSTFLLSRAQKKQLEEIDQQLKHYLNSELDKNNIVLELSDVEAVEALPQVKKLLRSRLKLLRPVVENILNGRDQPPVWYRPDLAIHSATSTVIRHNPVTFYNAHLSEYVKAGLSDSTPPLAIIWSDKDPYFPASLAEQSMKLDVQDRKTALATHKKLDIELKHRLTQLFPTAKSIIYAYVPAAGHNVAFTQPERFSLVCKELLTRMNIFEDDASHKKGRVDSTLRLDSSLR